jgi:hypothetical protein
VGFHKNNVVILSERSESKDLLSARALTNLNHECEFMNDGFVSGHGFSRAIPAQSNEGFSP